MGCRLIIVESPAKARSMDKYLGSEYTALACYGHVRDLLKKQDAVDPDNDFALTYSLLKRNEQHLKAILNAAKSASSIYLATDPDREGEAIAWHLHEILKDQGLLENTTLHRVVFHEFTPEAIHNAVANPGTLSLDLVHAQQARRALDHLVGFHLSPLLWKKIRQGLSAGRVQSPALRMIVDREAQITAFEAQEYWHVEADCRKLKAKDTTIVARLSQLNGGKIDTDSITNKEAALYAKNTLEAALNASNKRCLLVSEVRRKQHKQYPAPPFTTSTLQQEAARKLGFSAQRTMRTAQRLYEGLDGDGLITYMRTDSVELAHQAITQIRDFIRLEYGSDQLPEKPRQYSSSTKNAQEAHEAIRPTSISRSPDSLALRLDYDHLNLYTLIWERTMACQMIHATVDTVSADFSLAKAGIFHVKGSTLRHRGFLALYQEGKDEQPKETREYPQLPPLEKGEWLDLIEIRTQQHFTTPPPRYTEASLIKDLDAYGIGRPSTYASIISVLLTREYAILEKRQFLPTEIGSIVGKFLCDHFARYVDYEFTAKMENQLDAIARGEQQWKPVLRSFWGDFKQQLDEKQASVHRADIVKTRDLGADPETGKPVSVRLGRFGAFAQIGTREDTEKPRFASLAPGQRVESISLEEALTLFILPRQLGETDQGETVSTAIGRFGPYVRYADNFVPLLKDDSPYTINLEHALALIAEKKQMNSARIIKTYKGQSIQVLKGRYGPYITDGSTNARIPKKQIPEQLTLAQCRALISETASKKSQKTAAKRNKVRNTKNLPSNSNTTGKPKTKL